jgi:hypothetical protein
VVVSLERGTAKTNAEASVSSGQGIGNKSAQFSRKEFSAKDVALSYARLYIMFKGALQVTTGEIGISYNDPGTVEAV